MPYIPQEERNYLDPAITELVIKLRCTGCGPGQMNYVISRICNELFDSNPSYARINGIVGVLECAKAEFYRRKAVPYEENKIKENGDLP